jgi:hypothetical protein
MVVAINSNWQIPVAFYFVNRLLAEDTANLLTLQRLVLPYGNACNHCLKLRHLPYFTPNCLLGYVNYKLKL